MHQHSKDPQSVIWCREDVASSAFHESKHLAMLLVHKHPVLLLAMFSTVLHHLALATLSQSGKIGLLPIEEKKAVATFVPQA